jgi:hypothetical protein
MNRVFLGMVRMCDVGVPVFVVGDVGLAILQQKTSWKW